MAYLKLEKGEHS